MTKGLEVLRRWLLMVFGLSWSPGGHARPRTQIEPSLQDYAAGVLAHLLESARAQAIADGVKPVPSRIYRGLLGYFPPIVLQHVRYATGQTGGLTLPALAFTYGDATAMTLGEVVLFRDERAAETDLKLWAHELTHVMQYQRWGLDGFAAHYVQDTDAVEREANDNADRFVSWCNRVTH
jgi:hypothetical protein